MQIDEQKNKVAEYLAGIFYIATVEGDQPRVRPFDAAVVVDGVVYIGTNHHKKVYQQILKNPKVEIYVESEFGPMRIVAKVVTVEDQVKSKEIYMAMGKNGEVANLAVLGLTEVSGYLVNKLGEKVELNF